jgi:hypothetical protein
MISFKDVPIDKETKAFHEESEKIIGDFLKQVITNPHINQWWEKRKEKFRLEILKSMGYNGF